MASSNKTRSNRAEIEKDTYFFPLMVIENRNKLHREDVDILHKLLDIIYLLELTLLQGGG